MAFFDDLWDRLQGTERDIYQDLEERYRDLCGNWGMSAADSAIGSIQQLTVDEFDRRYPDDLRYTITINSDLNDYTWAASAVSGVTINGDTIYAGTTGWDANWTGYKENELDDVSEKELISIIGLEGGDV